MEWLSELIAVIAGAGAVGGTGTVLVRRRWPRVERTEVETAIGELQTNGGLSSRDRIVHIEAEVETIKKNQAHTQELVTDGLGSIRVEQAALKAHMEDSDARSTRIEEHMSQDIHELRQWLMNRPS